MGSAVVANSIFFYALASGMFKDAGLNVSYKLMSPSLYTATLASGDADIALGGASGAFLPPAQGKETSVMHSQVGRGSAAFVGGAPSIQSIEGCTKLVTTSKGSTLYGWAVSLQHVFGYTYDIVEVADPTTLVPTVASGKADCALADYGNISAGVAAGQLHLVFDPREHKDKLPLVIEGGTWGFTENLQAKHNEVTRFIGAMVKSGRILKSGDVTDEQVIDTLQTIPDFASQNKATLLTAYGINKAFFAPDDGYITEKAYTAYRSWLIDGGFPVNDTDEVWSYKRRVDMSYFKDSVGEPQLDS
jgi:ABC-type nitrate/sulfonate/bicarbonate transport system substrate-binding protein